MKTKPDIKKRFLVKKLAKFKPNKFLKEPEKFEIKIIAIILLLITFSLLEIVNA